MTTWVGISFTQTTYPCAEIKRIGTRRGTGDSAVMDGTNVGEIGLAFVHPTTRETFVGLE